MYAVNQIPLLDFSKSKTGCCVLIDPSEWDEREIVFKNKLFAKAKVRSFLHFPLNMGSVMGRTQEKINDAGAEPDEYLVLSLEETPWRSTQYFAVSKEVPGLEHELISGKFLTKVFEGPFKDAPKWLAELTKYAKRKGSKLLNTYFFYTTCPKCAKVYGKNYVVGFQQTV